MKLIYEGASIVVDECSSVLCKNTLTLVRAVKHWYCKAAHSGCQDFVIEQSIFQIKKYKNSRNSPPVVKPWKTLRRGLAVLFANLTTDSDRYGLLTRIK